MPGTPKCAWCGSADTAAGFDLVQCLACGLHTTMTGERAVPTSQANEGVTVDDIEVPDAQPQSTPDPAPAAATPTEENDDE